MPAPRTVHSIRSNSHSTEDLENNSYTEVISMWMGNIPRINANFMAGAIRGAVAGAVIGIAPAVLLIMVLSGGHGSYYMGLFEVLSFTAVSVTIGGLIGSIIGGTLNSAALFLKTALVKIGGIR